MVVQQLHNRWLRGESTDPRMEVVAVRLPILAANAASVLDRLEREHLGAVEARPRPSGAGRARRPRAGVSTSAHSITPKPDRPSISTAEMALLSYRRGPEWGRNIGMWTWVVARELAVDAGAVAHSLLS